MKTLDYYSNKYDLSLIPIRDFAIVEEHKLPAKMNVEYFVFGKTIYCRDKFVKMPNHEYLHLAQFKKYGIILSTFHYLFYIAINMFKYKNFKNAFENVPFEIEARNYENIIENND